jgi:hypothetical protein
MGLLVVVATGDHTATRAAKGPESTFALERLVSAADPAYGGNVLIRSQK